jgi:predicted ArsR family transcriptional regulator
MRLKASSFPEMPETIPPMRPVDVIHAVTDPVRWSILEALQVQKTVKQVADELGLTASNTQYHLKELSRIGLVEESRHPDYRRRFIYGRRTMQGEVKVLDRRLDATARIY